MANLSQFFLYRHLVQANWQFPKDIFLLFCSTVKPILQNDDKSFKVRFFKRIRVAQLNETFLRSSVVTSRLLRILSIPSIEHVKENEHGIDIFFGIITFSIFVT